MEVNTAYLIAKKGKDDFILTDCVDLGDRWAFTFEPYGFDDPPAPDNCPVTVDKITGAMECLPIPPIENLQLLKAGKKVFFRILEN